MSKTITITVVNTEETPTTETITKVVEHTEQNPEAIPSDSDWDDLLKFQDKHIGGRPIGR